MDQIKAWWSVMWSQRQRRQYQDRCLVLKPLVTSQGAGFQKVKRMWQDGLFSIPGQFTNRWKNTPSVRPYKAVISTVCRKLAPWVSERTGGPAHSDPDNRRETTQPAALAVRLSRLVRLKKLSLSSPNGKKKERKETMSRKSLLLW